MAPLGCGVMTGMGTVLNHLKPAPGSSIAVFGAGAVGLAAVMAARIVGCREIIAVDIRANRLDVARAVGATHAIEGSADDLVDAIIRATDGGAHYSMDTTGVPKIAESSILCLRKRGRSAQVAAAKPGTRYSVDPTQLLSRGIDLGVVVEGDIVPSQFIPQMIDFYRRDCCHYKPS